MIRVRGREMKQNLVSCVEIADSIGGKYGVLQEDLCEVAGAWDGASADLLLKNMEKLMEELQRDCVRMRILLTGISQAMGIYDTCEREMERYVQS